MQGTRLEYPPHPDLPPLQGAQAFADDAQRPGIRGMGRGGAQKLLRQRAGECGDVRLRKGRLRIPDGGAERVRRQRRPGGEKALHEPARKPFGGGTARTAIHGRIPERCVKQRAVIPQPCGGGRMGGRLA